MKLSNAALATIIVVLWVGVMTTIVSHGVRLGGAGYRAGAAILPGALEALTNTDRTGNALPSLANNPLLDEAAQMKANDMATRGYYGHVSPEGWLPFHWLDAVGYKYLNVGENLDLVYTGTGATVNSDWMNSAEHRTNILLPQFTETGVGVADGAYQGNPVTFVVELFATPLPAEAGTTTAQAPEAPPVLAPTPAPSAPLSAAPVSTAAASSAPSAPVVQPETPAVPQTEGAASSSVIVLPAPEKLPAAFEAGSSSIPVSIRPVLPNLYDPRTYQQAVQTAVLFLADALHTILSMLVSVR